MTGAGDARRLPTRACLGTGCSVVSMERLQESYQRKKGTCVGHPSHLVTGTLFTAPGGSLGNMHLEGQVRGTLNSVKIFLLLEAF